MTAGNDSTQVATSWTRIDGVIDPVLQSVRNAICGLVMKYPGIEEVRCGHACGRILIDDPASVHEQADICKRIGNVFPCEVKELLLAMIGEGVLRSRRVAPCARPRLFRPDTQQQRELHCYWTTPAVYAKRTLLSGV